MLFLFLFPFLLAGCASTELVESPKTGFVPENQATKDPAIFWTSRTLNRPFDYLGVVKVRSWTYEGALERLQEGAKELRADALMDVHYEKIGFLYSMNAFAIKYKS